MAVSATGTSVKGIQQLVFDASAINYAYVRVLEGSIGAANLRGFISLEFYNSVSWYQVVGSSLWYEGLVLVPGGGFNTNLLVLANWREDGLTWEAGTG